MADPIVLELEAVPPGIHERLYVLIDELDVTEFATLGGTTVAIELAVPLAPGSRELQLIELLPDGNLEVRGIWTLDIRQSALFESVGASADVTQIVSLRVADHETPGLPAQVTGNGGAYLKANLKREGLRLSATAPVSWDTLEQNYAGDNVTVDNWLLEGASGPATLKIGHQYAAKSTLAMENFSRRGVSGQLQSERFRSSISGFAVRGSAIKGFSNGVGLNDANDRIAGLSVDTQPIQSEWGQLSLNGVWLTGSAPANGGQLSGVVGDNAIMDGSSWAFEGLASLLDGRIQAFGGFSQSRSKFTGTSTRTDEAHSVTVILEPFPGFALGEHPVVWRVTLDQSTIGTDYLSLGNPGLGSDIARWTARSDFEAAGLNFSAYGGRIEDNVNDDNGIPSVRADAWTLEASFTPAQLLNGERRGPLRWLGMPTLSGSFSQERAQPTDIPAGFLEPEKLWDDRVNSSTGRLEFAYDSFIWSVGHSITDTNAFHLGGVSSVLNVTDISGEALWDEFYFVGSFQVDREAVRAASNRSNYQVGFNVRAPMLPERVYFSGHTSFNWSKIQDGSSDDFSINAGGSIDWTVVQPAEGRPGLTLSLLGNYQGNTSYVDSSLDGDAYQFYLKAAVTWPISFGHL